MSELLFAQNIPIRHDPELVRRGLEYDPGIDKPEACHCGAPLVVARSGFVVNGPYLVTRECCNGHSKIRRLSDYTYQQYIASLQ